jgi:hypothetical protein
MYATVLMGWLGLQNKKNKIPFAKWHLDKLKKEELIISF